MSGRSQPSTSASGISATSRCIKKKYLTTDEALRLLEELDVAGDVAMGFPAPGNLSDGDSDNSDEENEGSSALLNRQLLEAPAEIIIDDDHSDEDIVTEPPKKKSKVKIQRKWEKKNRKSIAIECSEKAISEEATNAADPKDFFELFFDEDFIKVICEQSNIYALQKNSTNLNVTPEEVKILIGGMLLSSITPVTNKKLYWNKGDYVPHILANAIRRDRFLDILHNLHFADNTLQTSDRSYKLRPLFSHLSEKFKYHGGLSEHLAIDESMIPYFGKHYAKQFIRGKPIRFGFKMWAICSGNGYLHAFDMYMGKQSSEDCTEIASLGLGGNVVVKLLNDADVTGKKGHKIFFDNFFSSVTLIEYLTSKGIHASGTCRSNRTEKCPIVSEKTPKDVPRGTSDHMISGETLVVKWKDNKDVIMVSNHDSTDMKTVKRWIRERKTYADVQQPVCVNNYNKHMGYVDLMDQQCGTYRIRMRQRKWWWPIFSHLLACTVNNGCALMKKSVPTMNNYKFIEFLVLFYCKSYGTPRLSAGRPPSTKITDIARFDGKNHWIVHIEKTRRCKLCQSNAMFMCDKCDVGLHPKCFKKYHTSQ